MPENGELILINFTTENPCTLAAAEEVERLIRPAGDNYWLREVKPAEEAPTVNWVAYYDWYDNETTGMML